MKWIETNIGNIIIAVLLVAIVWKLGAMHAQDSRIDALRAITDAQGARIDTTNARIDQIMVLKGEK